VALGTRRFILEAVERNARIFTESLEMQLMELVIQPLTEFANQDNAPVFPRLIIIDGLDKCFDGDTQSEMVVSLSKVLQNTNLLPLRFLLISRPEQHIQETFDLKVSASLLDRLVLEDSHLSDGDIQTLLRDEFSNIKNNHPSVPQDWPISSDVEHIVRRSCGRFVYASTLLKYLSSSKDPVTHLNTILNLECPPERQGTPFADLDAFYSHMFSRVTDIETTKIILGIILFVNPNYDLFAPLSPTQISAIQTLSGVGRLLGMSADQAKIYLNELYPMIQYSQQGALYFPHANVADFLNDLTRSKSYHLDKSLVLKYLISRCFEILGLLFLSLRESDIY